MKKKNLFSEILQSVTKYFLILVAVVIIGIACSGIRVVESGNVALILRFGKLVGNSYEEQVHEPGLLLAFPYIIDEVITVPTGSVIEQSVTTYYTEGNAMTSDGAYVITGDQNVAVMSASVKYGISDPVAYALNVKDVPSLVDGFVSTAMLAEAASRDVDDLLTKDQDTFAQAVLQRASKKAETAGIGVTLNTIELTHVNMPEEVREIYDQVTSATVQATTIKENALKHREKLLPQAQTTADTEIALAQTAQSEQTAAAKRALAEFWGVVEEYKLSPDEVKIRIYNTKVNQMMSSIGKIRVVHDEGSKLVLMPAEEE